MRGEKVSYPFHRGEREYSQGYEERLHIQRFAPVFYIMSGLAFISFLTVLFFLPESEVHVEHHQEAAIPFKSLIKYTPPFVGQFWHVEIV